MPENTSSKKINLVLEACSGNTVVIAKHKNGRLKEIAIQSDQFQAENIAQFFFKTLAQNQINIQDVYSLSVCIGPGSYIATRAAAILANIIAQEYQITLNAFTHQEGYQKAKNVDAIEPLYS